MQLTTAAEPPYHIPVDADNGVFSVDMVRLELVLPGDAIDRLDTRMDTVQCDKAKSYAGRSKPGAYAVVWVLGFGHSTATIGLGWFQPSGKPDRHRGFIEFNPNKVAGDPRFGAFLERLKRHGVKARLKRFDIALDMPIPREWCSLVKDGRMYRCVVSNGITEYLGRKNKPGHVKLYDKAREMGEAGRAATRLELTCDSAWSAEDIAGKWPNVIHWTGDAEGKPITRVVAALLAEKSARGEPVEPYLHELHPTTRRKLVSSMQSAGAEITRDVAAALSNQARAWEHLQIL